MAEVLKITQENFETEVLQSDKPVLIDFWAEWCGPCQTFIPILHSYAEKTDAVKIGRSMWMRTESLQSSTGS